MAKVHGENKREFTNNINKSTRDDVTDYLLYIFTQSPRGDSRSTCFISKP